MRDIDQGMDRWFKNLTPEQRAQLVKDVLQDIENRQAWARLSEKPVFMPKPVMPALHLKRDHDQDQPANSASGGVPDDPTR